MSKQLTIVIVTGYSGSGKSTALDTFEDAGFYCVDNMPVHLIPHFLEQAEIVLSSARREWTSVM